MIFVLFQGSVPSEMQGVDALGDFHDVADGLAEAEVAAVLEHNEGGHRRSRLLHVQLGLEVGKKILS